MLVYKSENKPGIRMWNRPKSSPRVEWIGRDSKPKHSLEIDSIVLNGNKLRIWMSLLLLYYIII